MQFILTFRIERELILPIGYHHILQGFIYNCIQNYSEYSEFLHNDGYRKEGQSFKLFVFSLIKGHFCLKNKNIIFDDYIQFEVRSPVQIFCEIFYQSIRERKSFFLNEQRVFLEGFEVREDIIKKTEITVSFLSPVCVSVPFCEGDKQRNNYLNPKEPEFNYRLNQNFKNKYEAATGRKPSGSVFLLPIDKEIYKKYVTKFQNHIYITAWNGNFLLKGDIPALQFLYETGLGAHNSQGFGMFKVIK